jgi:uncharacterized protein (TIGR03435 family)
MSRQAQAEMHLMLQALLEQRFQLRLHRETRDLPVYEMTVAKGGHKLRQGNCIAFAPDHPPPPLASGQPVPNYCGSSRIGRRGLDWTMDGTGIGVSDFAGTISMLIGGRPVIDKTGFTGAFDVHLQWTSLPGESGDSDVATTPDSSGPSIFTVLQEQLGLRLRSGTGPVEVLVVDHVEKPSVN